MSVHVQYRQIPFLEYLAPSTEAELVSFEGPDHILIAYQKHQEAVNLQTQSEAEPNQGNEINHWD